MPLHTFAFVLFPYRYAIDFTFPELKICIIMLSINFSLTPRTLTPRTDDTINQVWTVQHTYSLGFIPSPSREVCIIMLSIICISCDVIIVSYPHWDKLSQNKEIDLKGLGITRKQLSTHATLPSPICLSRWTKQYFLCLLLSYSFCSLPGMP